MVLGHKDHSKTFLKKQTKNYGSIVVSPVATKTASDRFGISRAACLTVCKLISSVRYFAGNYFTSFANISLERLIRCKAKWTSQCNLKCASEQRSVWIWGHVQAGETSLEEDECEHTGVFLCGAFLCAAWPDEELELQLMLPGGVLSWKYFLPWSEHSE